MVAVSNHVLLNHHK